MKKFIDRLHFITHDLPSRSHIAQAEMACSAGAKWIQYRCFSKSDAKLLDDIKTISAICDDWGTTLIVTDHVHLAGKADIQGFHIEDMQTDFRKLRQQLGDEFTLGGSANDMANVIRISSQGADYAGVGPFSVTTTKPNSYPLVTLEGYRQIVNVVDFPVLAVGGIQLADVDGLLNTGIHGIALSAAVNLAPDPVAAFEDLHTAIISSK